MIKNTKNKIFSKYNISSKIITAKKISFYKIGKHVTADLLQ